MSIYFVDESIFDKKLQCVLCPVRGSQLFMYKEICGKIYDLADKAKLKRAYELNEACRYKCPIITPGFNLSEYIMHIVVPDMSASKHFEFDMFDCYHQIVKLLLTEGFKNIVFPCLPYSYKRLGNMNSYRTQKTLLMYFSFIYNIETDIYILTDKKTMNDHLNDYVSTYVSTSYPMSKRHAPLDYPLINEEKLNDFIAANDILEIEAPLLEDRNFYIEFKDNIFSFLYEEIHKQYDDNTFCVHANMNKYNYILLFEGTHIPSKNELIGMSLALSYNVNQCNELLSLINEKLDDKDLKDQIIINSINNEDFDVIGINERLFMLDLSQIGSDYVK